MQGMWCTHLIIDPLSMIFCMVHCRRAYLDPKAGAIWLRGVAGTGSRGGARDPPELSQALGGGGIWGPPSEGSCRWLNSACAAGKPGLQAQAEVNLPLPLQRGSGSPAQLLSSKGKEVQSPLAKNICRRKAAPGASGSVRLCSSISQAQCSHCLKACSPFQHPQSSLEGPLSPTMSLNSFIMACLRYWPAPHCTLNPWTLPCPALWALWLAFHNDPVFDPCLGRSARLAGNAKFLCLSLSRSAGIPHTLLSQCQR